MVMGPADDAEAIRELLHARSVHVSEERRNGDPIVGACSNCRLVFALRAGETGVCPRCQAEPCPDCAEALQRLLAACPAYYPTKAEIEAEAEALWTARQASRLDFDPAADPLPTWAGLRGVGEDSELYRGSLHIFRWAARDVLMRHRAPRADVGAAAAGEPTDAAVEVEARALWTAFRAAQPPGFTLPPWEELPDDGVLAAWRATARDGLMRRRGVWP